MVRLMAAVYDGASQTYGQPMFVVARGQAVRAFSDEVRRASNDNALYLHPEDFHLCLIGAFDDVTGAVESFTPETLVRGKDCAMKDS